MARMQSDLILPVTTSAKQLERWCQGSKSVLRRLCFQLEKYAAAGLQTDLQYAAFGTNELNFQMGSQATAGLRAFFWNYRGSRQYLFSAGLAAERIARDLEYGAYKPESGGRFLHAQAEAVFFFGRFSLQCQAGLPLLREITPAQPAAGLRLGFGGALIF